MTLAIAIDRMRRGLSVTRSELLAVLDAAEAYADPVATARRIASQESEPRYMADVPFWSSARQDKPLAEQFSPNRLPPETGYVHSTGKR